MPVLDVIATVFGPLLTATTSISIALALALALRLLQGTGIALSDRINAMLTYRSNLSPSHRLIQVGCAEINRRYSKHASAGI